MMRIVYIRALDILHINYKNEFIIYINRVELLRWKEDKKKPVILSCYVYDLDDGLVHIKF